MTAEFVRPIGCVLQDAQFSQLPPVVVALVPNKENVGHSKRFLFVKTLHRHTFHECPSGSSENETRLLFLLGAYERQAVAASLVNLDKTNEYPPEWCSVG